MITDLNCMLFLRLTDNGIGDEGTAILAEGLSDHRKLEVLR